MFKSYHVENKLPFYEMKMMPEFALDQHA